MDAGSKAKTLDEFERETKGPSGGGKKKPAKASMESVKKPANAGKAGQEQDGAQESAEEVVRKRHPVRNALIFTSLFWLLMIGVVIAVCCLRYTDEYGDIKFLADPGGVIRGPILAFLNPEELSRDEYYSAELDEIKDLTDEWEARHEELDAIEAELDARADELDDWETRLQDWEDMLDEQMPENGTSTAVTADIATLAKAWGEMTPSNAAAAIAEMSDDAVTVQVLRLIKFKSLGKILDAMGAEEAARISELLAEPPDLE